MSSPKEFEEKKDWYLYFKSIEQDYRSITRAEEVKNSSDYDTSMWRIKVNVSNRLLMVKDF